MRPESHVSGLHGAGRPPVDNRAVGLLRRLAALAYDCVLLLGLIAAYGFVIVYLRGGDPVAPSTPWFSAGLVTLAGLFFCWFWTHGGQTLGMLAWRIRLVTTNGGAIGWRRAVARYCAAWLSLLPAGLGFFWALWDPERATWHDRLTDTRMRREPADRGW
jgi:uncharacterized RDD family membrane protein YckC